MSVSYDAYAIPPEVIRETIRVNQKCFVTTPKDDPGKLAPYFLYVANISAKDGGAAITSGVERVARARLTDAAFFWRLDFMPLPAYEHYVYDLGDGEVAPFKPLDHRVLLIIDKGITFRIGLGTIADRVARVTTLCSKCSMGRRDLTMRAARLCKADLVTETVGEFPTLQGIIGSRLARAQGEDPEVCAAIEEHYLPKSSGGPLPVTMTGAVLAIMDKVDMLVGFWMVGEKPSSTKDPFALKRSAVGICRIFAERLKIHTTYIFGYDNLLWHLFSMAWELYVSQSKDADSGISSGFDLPDHSPEAKEAILRDLVDFCEKRYAQYTKASSK